MCTHFSGVSLGVAVVLKGVGMCRYRDIERYRYGDR